MKKTLFLFLFSFLFITLSAQVPQGYYNAAEGKSNASLKTALHQIIEVGTRLSYGSGSGSTWSGFEKSDLHPDGHVWDMYSLNKVNFPGNGGAASGMNIEHSVAKSWWGGSSNDAYKDLYHLNPSNSTANSARSNYPLGINTGSKFNNGSIKVGHNTYETEYTGLCFEPLDEYKGDFARAYLYMFTCYEDYSWTGTSAPFALNANETWPMLKNWTKDLLVEWHRKDPVSEKELKRVSEIYKIQNNRNPFVDYPELVEFLWGTHVGQSWSPQGGDYAWISSPAYGESVDFGKVALGESSKYTLTVKAENLKSDLALTVSGTDATDFSLSVSTLAQATAENGAEVIVSFTANSVGEKNAVLSISGEGVNTVNISLKALSSDDFMALPATEIISTGFTANWTSSATANSYLLNVFTLSDNGDLESQMILSEEFKNGLPASWSSDGFSEGTDDGTIKMASGSRACTLTTPTLDLSADNNMLYARAKQYSGDTGAALTVTVDGQDIAVWTTSSSFETFSVALPSATSSSSIAFNASSGKRIYLDSVNVSSQAPAQIAESLSGYPVTLGNVLTYQVDGLIAQTNYYYTVTPIGGNTGESERINVMTYTVGTDDIDQDKISFFSKSSGIVVRNISADSHIVVYNMLGRKLTEINPTTSDLTIDVHDKGAYVIRVESNRGNKSYKVIY
jgi:endonuclease I